MRAFLQRVSKAEVSINDESYSKIQHGLLVLLAVGNSDNREDIDWLVKKILNMRIFDDEKGKMNLSLKNVEYEILVVSQFTLYAFIKKSNRPSFQRAAVPREAVKLYDAFVETLCTHVPGKVKTGKFAANMQISLVNDGPVTLLLDSRKKDL